MQRRKLLNNIITGGIAGVAAGTMSTKAVSAECIDTVDASCIDYPVRPGETGVIASNYIYGDVRRYGAGSGLKSDWEAFRDANASWDSILVEAGQYVIDRNLDIRTHMEIGSGAILNITAGVTVTIYKSLDAGLYQIFDCQADGKVVFDNRQPNYVPVVYAEWWGAIGDGDVEGDDSKAIQAAINAAPIGGVVELQEGTYVFSASLTIDKNLTFRGKNRNASALLWTAHGSNTIIVEDDVTDVFLMDFSLDNVRSANNGIYLKGVHNYLYRLKIFPTVAYTNAAVLSRTGGQHGSQVLAHIMRDRYLLASRNPGSGSHGIGWEIPWAVNATVDQCWFENFETGLYIGSSEQECAGVSVLNSYFNAFTTAGLSANAIHIKNSANFTIRDSFFEMATDDDSDADLTKQLCIKLANCKSGIIEGNYLAGNGKLDYAIKSFGKPVENIILQGNVFWRCIKAGVELVDGESWEFGHNTALNTPEVVSKSDLWSVAQYNINHQPMTNVLSLSASDVKGTNLCGQVQLYNGIAQVNLPNTEPDANYLILLTGNRDEIFRFENPTNSGFLIRSTNAYSDATVNWLILRS